MDEGRLSPPEKVETSNVQPDRRETHNIFFLIGGV